MNKSLAILGIALVALVITVTVIFTSFWIYSPTMDGSRGHGMRGNVDSRFIEQMVQHHEEAVAMADIALTKAEHPEIRQLAENIKHEQTREISLMREWYKKWYGTDVPASSRMMGNMTDLEELENAKPFDKEFIEQMTLHHQMAIMMAQMAMNNSNRPEIRGIANSIIKTQSAEISEMRQWYKEWYGTDVPTYPGMMGSGMGMMSGV